MSLDAMKQALDALEWEADGWQDVPPITSNAITALRAAIEQAETPEKRRAKVDSIRVRIMQEAYDLADRDDSEGYNSVKVMCSDVLSMINALLDERQWQGLTNSDIDQVIPYCHNEFDLAEFREFARNIEAKLKEKNHA
jgi:hypothetical protein